jgi:hypothetical protein
LAIAHGLAIPTLRALWVKIPASQASGKNWVSFPQLETGFWRGTLRPLPLRSWSGTNEALRCLVAGTEGNSNDTFC